ncbi:hypothetical protein MNBD_NITROSPINAE02-2179 [hydrothermal vent metagenome]|uniref:4Fe-4S ferredoxin-type domain-containing protein n=1 Tax=hydrothermal vent metagenome TaxID=652676 RepID=A0A3B1BST9_9ZZZZ
MPTKTFTQELAEWSELNLLNCIGVDECMKACPVVDPELSIGELNEATREGSKLTPMTLKFAKECIQCGRCDAVCPTVASRSIMMLTLKEKMAKAGKAPEAHAKYFKIRGEDRSSTIRAGYNLYTKAKWSFKKEHAFKNAKLSRHIDKTTFKQAEYLFYFGCYIFGQHDSAAKTIDIADKLKMDYEVLGGLKSCCGWPQLIAGRTDEAEKYHKNLEELVKESNPKYVISGCAECFMSLRKIKEKYSMSFEPLTTPMWLNMFTERLNLKKSDDIVTYHDSCHISRKIGKPEPARELLKKMCEIKEMPRSGADDTFCCGYWGLGANPSQLEAIHFSRFDEASATGAKEMIVECVTCYDSFMKHADKAGARPRDIVDLVHERMDVK